MSELETFEVKTLFDNDEKSVAYIVLKGVNRGIRNLRSKTTYYVVIGEGKFHTADTVTNVETGSLITIPAGTAYYDEGNLTLLALSEPAFRAEDVQELPD